jgi:tRNA threonylcarbamoyladenosine biosynthesis protein TsaE
MGRMNTGMTWQTKSESSEQTEKLAARLGKALKGGEVIELVSDLGGGKTTFVRGLAHGTGSKDKVGSPTFTISKVYNAPKFDIHHFDFYRLPDPGLVGNELAEVLGDEHIVTVIEWADVVSHVLPSDRLHIDIKQTPDGARELTFRASPPLAYLLEAVKE